MSPVKRYPVEIARRALETQGGELVEQQDRGDHVIHEHRRAVGRDEAIDPRQLDVRERPCQD